MPIADIPSLPEVQGGYVSTLRTAGNDNEICTVHEQGLGGTRSTVRKIS